MTLDPPCSPGICLGAGNGYDADLLEGIAKEHNLFHLKTSPEAYAELTSDKNVKLLSEEGLSEDHPALFFTFYYTEQSLIVIYTDKFFCRRLLFLRLFLLSSLFSLCVRLLWTSSKFWASACLALKPRDLRPEALSSLRSFSTAGMMERLSILTAVRASMSTSLENASLRMFWRACTSFALNTPVRHDEHTFPL